MERTNLNPASVVGVFSEVCAAGMTRGHILNVIRAAHRVEGTARTGAVSVAQGRRSVEGREAVSRTHVARSFTAAVSRPHSTHSPILSDLVMIDLRDFLCGTAHEEERDAQEGGGGQHHHREAWDGLQGETCLLHDDSTHQHPHGYSRQVQRPWEP